MKTGLSRLTGVLFLPLFLTVYSCQETQTALPAEDSVDGILDLLDSVSGQVELPAITDPTLTLTDPSSQWVYLQLATPVTPMTVSFLVTNWTFPHWQDPATATLPEEMPPDLEDALGDPNLHPVYVVARDGDEGMDWKGFFIRVTPPAAQ